MVCLFTGCEDVLEWVDAFASVTGLAPSDCTLVLTELVGFSRPSELFLEAINFERHEAHLDEVEKQQLHNERESLQDDEADDDDVAERFAHYRKVLSHHGFSDDFYTLFRKNLSPTSETRPMVFTIDKAAVFTTRFNKDPFVAQVDPDDEPEVDEEELHFDPSDIFGSLFAGGASMIDRMRLSRPVNPVGWHKMLEHLGFEIKPVEAVREEPWYPKFYAYKDAVRHPVFIAGPSKTPFDTEDEQAKEIRDGIGELNVLSPSDVPLLFWSSPVMLGKANAPYWGEMRVEGKWYEMFITEAVCRVGEMLKVSKLMAAKNNQSYDEAVKILKDKEHKLVSWFMQVHKDPMIELAESMMHKHRKQ